MDFSTDSIDLIRVILTIVILIIIASAFGALVLPLEIILSGLVIISFISIIISIFYLLPKESRRSEE